MKIMFNDSFSVDSLKYTFTKWFVKLLTLYIFHWKRFLSFYISFIVFLFLQISIERYLEQVSFRILLLGTKQTRSIKLSQGGCHDFYTLHSLNAHSRTFVNMQAKGNAPTWEHLLFPYFSRNMNFSDSLKNCSCFILFFEHNILDSYPVGMKRPTNVHLPLEHNVCICVLFRHYLYWQDWCGVY